MAQVQGFTCDLDTCKTFTTSHHSGVVPHGWFRLQLPRTEMDRTDVEHRDFCSARCVERFAKQRREADDGIEKKEPIVTDAMRAWLAEQGVSGRPVASLAGNHARRHIDEPNDDCLICDFLSLPQTQVKAA